LLQIFICCRNRSSWEGESDSWIASWQCFCAMDSFHTTSGGPCQYHVWHWIDYCLIVWSMFLPYVLGTKWWCGLLCCCCLREEMGVCNLRCKLQNWQLGFNTANWIVVKLYRLLKQLFFGLILFMIRLILGLLVVSLQTATPIC
jgi:hypothetical protein